MKLPNYFAPIKIGILDAISYRFDLLMGWLSSIVLVLTQYYLWKVVFQQQATINHFTFQDTATYLVLAWVIRPFYSTTGLSRDIQDKFLVGSISYDLLLPTNYQGYNSLIAYGQNCARLVITGIPTFFMFLFILGVETPTPIDLIAFVISIHLSFAISTTLSMLVGLCTVYLKNIEGAIQLQGFLVSILSGALVPLAFLPPILQRIADLLPFRYLVFTPITIYLGKLTASEILAQLAIQLIWCLILILFTQLFMHKAMRKMEVFGG